MKEIDKSIEKAEKCVEKTNELENLIKKAFSLKNRSYSQLQLDNILDLVNDCLQLEKDILILKWLNQIKQKLEELI